MFVTVRVYIAELVGLTTVVGLFEPLLQLYMQLGSVLAVSVTELPAQTVLELLEITTLGGAIFITTITVAVLETHPPLLPVNE